MAKRQQTRRDPQVYKNKKRLFTIQFNVVDLAYKKNVKTSKMKTIFALSTIVVPPGGVGFVGGPAPRIFRYPPAHQGPTSFSEPPDFDRKP